MPRWPPLSGIVVLTLVTACNTTSTSTPPSTAPPPSGGTGPIPVTYTLDTAHAKKATVDAAGTTVTATGADGTTYTLVIPSGALATPVDITLTPLTNVAIQGTRAAWQVGIELKPQGLQFLQPVDLTVAPPKPSPSSAAITLVTSDGTRYVPEAAGTTGATFTAQLLHFSDYVVGPTSPAMLGDAIRAILANLATTPTVEDLQSLITLWADAQGSTLSKLRDELAKKIEAEIAALTSQQQNNDQPTAGDVQGSLNAGALASKAGRTADAATLQDNAQRVFATLMRVLQQQRYQALYHISALELLVPPLAQAAAIARAHPAILQGGSVIDPQSEAEALVTQIVNSSDWDCDHAHFSAGVTGIQDSIGAVHLLSLTSPTPTDLQNDAATCVPPVITNVSVPANLASASASYGPAGAVDQQSAPQAAETTAKGSYQALASVNYASSLASLKVTADSSSAQLTFAGKASAQLPSINQPSPQANSTFAMSDGNQVRVNIAHTRGDSLIELSWQHSSSVLVPYEGGASMTVDLKSDTSGSLTFHTPGMHYTLSLGYPLPAGGFNNAYKPHFNVQGAAGIDTTTPDQSVSVSVNGTITVKVLPDPNGVIE